MRNLIDNLLNGSVSPCQRLALTCDPVTMTVAAGGMAAGQAGMDIYGQFQAQKTHNVNEEAKRMQQETVIEENRRRATKDYLTSVRLEQQQQTQEQDAVVQKSFDVKQQSNIAAATGIASAAERGVAGRTVDQIAQDFDTMANEETGRLKANQQVSNQQHGENISSFGNEYYNRVSAVKPYIKQSAAPIDFFGPIFKAGAQTLNTGAATGAFE